MTTKIFVADDSITIQKIVSLAFNDEDAIVESVTDGDIALDSLRKFQPDVALVDVFIPGCSGYEICARIKEDPELSHIPVILLVGTFEPFDESEAARVKCDSYLTKPFDTAELLQTVHVLVEKRAAEQQSNAPMEIPVINAPIHAVSAPESGYPAMRNLVSPPVLDSFVGSGRILDLFDSETLKAAEILLAENDRLKLAATAKETPSTKSTAAVSDMSSEEMLNTIVDRVLRRMSADIIREVAWEVVPELSENIIQRTIEEQNKA